MRNLKKHLLLLVSLGTILLFAFFVEKAAAVATPTPTLTPTQYGQCVNDCNSTFEDFASRNLCLNQCTCYEACRTSLGEQACFDNCNPQIGAPTPTPTTSTPVSRVIWKQQQQIVCPTPTLTQSGEKTCDSVDTSCPEGKVCQFKSCSAEGDYCSGTCVPITPTLTPTLTATAPTNTPPPGATNTPIPTPGVGGQPVVPTPTLTPTPTPIPNLFSCVNQTGSSGGQYQCASIINGSIQCSSGFAPFTPSSPPYTGTSCENGKGCCKEGPISTVKPFACLNQTVGTFAGNYECASIANDTTQCSPGFTAYSPPSPFTGTTCLTGLGCCKQGPTPTPTSILLPTATPTPPPGSRVLALSLTLEGIGANRTNLPSNIETSPVTVEVFKILGKTKTPVSTKEGNVEYESENGKFEGTVDVGNLGQGQYVTKIKIDNYLKRQSRTFTVGAVQPTQNIPVSTTLLAGDIVRVNKGDGSIEVGGDGKIDIADYNAVILSCFGAKINTPSCTIKNAVDINHDRKVDGLEYNIIVRNFGKTDD